MRKEHRPIVINEYGAIVIDGYQSTVRGITIGQKRPNILYYCPACMHNAFKTTEKAHRWLNILICALEKDAKIRTFK